MAAAAKASCGVNNKHVCGIAFQAPALFSALAKRYWHSAVYAYASAAA